METPISPSCIDPVEPDNRPRMDLLIAKINYDLTQNTLKDEVKIDLSGLNVCEEELETLCKLYEDKGWFCYCQLHFSFALRAYMYLSKNQINRRYYYIKDNKIVEESFMFLIPHFGERNRGTCERALSDWELIKHRYSLPNKTKKSWIEKLFG